MKEDLGLTSQDGFDSKKPPRGETEKGQRPQTTDKTVKSDRGSFKDKC